MHTAHMDRLAAMFAALGVACVRYTFISPKVEKRAAKLKVSVIIGIQNRYCRRRMWWRLGLLLWATMCAEVVCLNAPPTLHPIPVKEVLAVVRRLPETKHIVRWILAGHSMVRSPNFASDSIDACLENSGTYPKKSSFSEAPSQEHP